MFQITLSDHVRLSFGSALAAYEGHAEAAAKLGRRNSYSKLALLGLSGVATVVSAVAVQGGYGWQMAAAILTAAVFGSCAMYIGVNQQLLGYGHRASAAKPWVICVQYLPLLSEMREDLIGLPSLQSPRNAGPTESATRIGQA